MLTIATPVDSDSDFTRTTTDIVEVNGGKTDDVNFPGLRVRFKIEKSLEKTPNTSEIVVSNLSPSHRSSLQVKGVKVLLEAGYKSTGIKRLFAGDVRTTDHVRNGADWDSTLKLGDGERAWQFARVDESFAPGVRVADVIKKIAAATGLEIGNADKQAAKIDRVLDQGYIATGNAVRALDRIVTAVGKQLSIQDGQIQILGSDETLDLPVPELTKDTGLIGSPEMGSPATKKKPAMVRIKCLLLAVKPGSRVYLRTAGKPPKYDGYVRVHKISHEGDTHGGNWYSIIDGSIVK
jgi:hypothetical protein